MSDTNTNVLITGANRGVGLAFIQTYLSRPNHTVIGTVRDVAAARAKGFEDIPAAPGSKLILVKLESASFTDPAKAVEELVAQGITKLDIVIANAAVNGGKVLPVAEGHADSFLDTLAINVVGPSALFSATHKLLEAAPEPKWVTITSTIGSLASVGPTFEAMGRKPLGYTYGASKAALNYLSVTIHTENPGLMSMTLCPGFMDTDMGNEGAKYFGFDRPPQKPLDNVKAMVEIVASAKRETHSGKFWNFEGKEVPW